MNSPTSAQNRFNTSSPTALRAHDNPLTVLIRRLEAATSRLEDIAQSASSFEHPRNQPHGPAPAPAPAPVQSSSSVPNLATASRDALPPPPPTPAEASLPPTVAAMDGLIHDQLDAFKEASKGINPLVEEQATAIIKAFGYQRRFILASTKAKKPDLTNQQTVMALVSDFQHAMTEASDIHNTGRAGEFKDSLAMVSEGAGAFQWLLIDEKPGDFLGNIIGGAQLFGNKVLSANKKEGGDQKLVKYVHAYIALLKALQAYATKHYPRGLTWKNDGIDAVPAYKESASGAGGPPPPPPPPPLPNFENVPPPPGPAPPASKNQAGDMGAVFEQLNRGEAVTAGLKKVDKSQMTHKNPSLRAGATVSEVGRSKSPGPGPTKPKPASMRQNSTASAQSAAKAEGKKELDGNKWYIENWDSPSQPIEVDVSLAQSLLISKCKNTTIILHGKANAVSIDNSPRTQILVETLVSSVDVIKSPNFAVQVTGSLPTIMLDQVDGASIYLGKESLATEVFTSKCSSVNIVLPPAREEDDSKECPLPEQIRTFVKDGRVVSEIVEHAG
jgi:adenylyl cyclase-associated protein